MVVLTLLIRDEADIVESTVAFHLNAGVDFVIATDHRSEDGSREILERYESQGVLRLIREDAEAFDSTALRTRMARLAAERYGADWVIGADADEFFWPRGGSLADVFAVIPQRFGVVHAPWHFFLPRSDEDTDFAERMTARLSAVWPSHPRSPFKADVKIAHRGDPRVVVQGGNHRLLTPGHDPVPGWHPIDVLHFPIRSVQQLERKIAHWSRAGRSWRFERSGISDAAGWFEDLAVADDDLAVGIDDGTFTVDTRLRDTLRLLRPEGPAGRPLRLPPESPRISFAGWSASDQRAHLAVRTALGHRGIQRLQRRADDLAARVASLESRGPTPDPVG